MICIAYSSPPSSSRFANACNANYTIKLVMITNYTAVDYHLDSF